MPDTGSRLRALACRSCCAEVAPERPVGPCPTCGSALLAEYDLAGFDGRTWWSSLARRPATLWRYRELLPVRASDRIVSLGEGFSPIVDLATVDEPGGLRLAVKDDGGLPTGSFKARGMAVAVARARELGLKELFVPSAGNAGVALAAYGARAGLTVRIYLPERTPAPMRLACASYGAEVLSVPGTIRDAGEAARRAETGRGSFDMSTLREPYRAEGKKTMGLEIVEQLGPDELPEVILYPTGGGTGLVGMYKAFTELRTLGLLDRLPRLVSVQPEGCAPIVRALTENAPRVRPWEQPSTIAPGLLVPAPFASERVLEAVRATGGSGITVTDREIHDAVAALARRFGVSASPEGAAPFAALPHLLANGTLRAGMRVLLYNTGSGIPFVGNSSGGDGSGAGGRGAPSTG
ncbi:MAG TPA: threonine synthase [Thermoplasmata archaeon]|nr:threonine synthase [Thermoplasmata archaeon]